MRLEQAGKVVPGTFQYFGASVDARHYVPAGPVVIGNRLQLGSVAGDGSSSATIPFSKRLFLGGATSIRGWGRYEISPLSGSGLPLGGESLFAWSSEARVPLTEKFGAVAFLDVGNVWADPWTLRLADLRYAVGPGLRYQTPIGSIRFDVGFQLNPISDLLVPHSSQVENSKVPLHVTASCLFLESDAGRLETESGIRYR